MAVNNNVNQNSQEQIIQEQIRQQQVQQNQTVNNPTNNVEPVGATNTETSNPQPAVPSNETAQVQQMLADGNATKATLNNQVDQIAIVLPPTDPAIGIPITPGTDIVDTLPANLPGLASTLKTENSIPYSQTEENYEIKNRVQIANRDNNMQGYHNYQASLSPGQAVEFGARGGFFNNGFSLNLGSIISSHDGNLGFAKQVFEKLGSKGTAGLLSSSNYETIDDMRNGGTDVASAKEYYGGLIDGLRKSGNFNQGDMYELAKAALNINTAQRDFKTEDGGMPNYSDFVYENIQSDKEMGVGIHEYYAKTSISKLDEFFDSESRPELKAMWEKGLGAAIDDKLAPKTQIIAGNPQGVGNNLESLLKTQNSIDGQKIIEAGLEGSESKKMIEALLDAQIQKRTNKDGGNPIAYINSAVGNLVNGEEKRANKFIDNLLKKSAGTTLLASNSENGVYLGELIGSHAFPGDKRFGLKAIDYAHTLRDPKNNSAPIQLASIPAILDAALTSLSISNSEQIPKDLSIKLNEADYKDIAKFGSSLKSFFVRTSAYESNDRMNNDMFFKVGKNVGEANTVSKEALKYYFEKDPSRVVKNLSSDGPNVPVFKNIIERALIPTKKDFEEFMKDSKENQGPYHKVVQDYLDKMISADGDLKTNLAKQMKGFNAAVFGAIEQRNEKIGKDIKKGEWLTEKIFEEVKKIPILGGISDGVKKFTYDKLKEKGEAAYKKTFELSGKEAFYDLMQSQKSYFTDVQNAITDYTNVNKNSLNTAQLDKLNQIIENLRYFSDNGFPEPPLDYLSKDKKEVK
jgi:hypothetical protein